jgi:hypothetical protein
MAKQVLIIDAAATRAKVLEHHREGLFSFAMSNGLGKHYSSLQQIMNGTWLFRGLMGEEIPGEASPQCLHRLAINLPVDFVRQCRIFNAWSLL